MARMYPDVDPAELEHASEATVYAALRRDLSDEFTVIHSYPWLREEDEALREGEADFVIAHRDLGLLIIEVKGGDTIRYSEFERRWLRDTQNGPREFKDPFNQAQRNMHALLDTMKERSGGRLNRNMLTYGYAVWFPDMEYRGEPPPHADKAIILTTRHLSAADQAIETAMRRWQREPRALSPGHFRLLLNECLLPKFGLFRPAGRDINADSQRLLELTAMQQTVFEGLYAQDRVLVRGAAGSGKTLLALSRALSFARAGKRTLFTCYNKDLASWLREEVDSDPDVDAYREHLTIANFHQLSSSLAKEAQIPFAPASGGSKTQQFWEEEVPEIMEQAIDELTFAGRDPRFDALVVDEAQDFTLTWWIALETLLQDPNETPLYAFMDPHQALRSEVVEPAVSFGASFELKMNCRNTRRIANASSEILGLNDIGVLPHAPLGLEVRVVRAPSSASQRGLVSQEVGRLLSEDNVSPDQIVVMGPASKTKGSLSDLGSFLDIPAVTDHSAWRRGEGVLVTTARSFKGLEAEVVVLYDLGNFTSFFTKQDLYVASTRAKTLLICIAHEGDIRPKVELASALSRTA